MSSIKPGDSQYSVYKNLKTSEVLNSFKDGSFISQVFESLSNNIVNIDPFDSIPAIQLQFHAENGTGRIEFPDSTEIKNISSSVKNALEAKSSVLALMHEVNSLIYRKNPTPTNLTIAQAIRLLDSQAAKIQMSKLDSALVQGSDYQYLNALSLFGRINSIRQTILTQNKSEGMIGDWRVILPYSLVATLSGKESLKESFTSALEEFKHAMDVGMFAWDYTLHSERVLVYDANKITHYKGLGVGFEALSQTDKGKVSQDRFIIEACTDDILASDDNFSVGESFLVTFQ